MPKFIFVVAGMVCLLAGGHCLGRDIPPGKYSMSGRVVESTDFGFGILEGIGAYYFTKPLQSQLQPYLNKIVKVDYTRIAVKDAISEVAPVGSIDKITVLADSIDKLPITVTAKPTQSEYGFGQPVTVLVTIENHTDSVQVMDLSNSETALCQGFMEKHFLETADHVANNRFYNKFPREVDLATHGKIEFTVTSSKMIPPGAYQLIYFLSATVVAPLDSSTKIDLLSSEDIPIFVRPPKDDAERKEALKAWLKNAAPESKIAVAVQLLGLGDTSGRDEVLHLLETGAYAPRENWSYGWEIPFAFRNGGDKGEALAMALLEQQTRQSSALRMLEGVEFSPHRGDLLQTLLACDHPTDKDCSGWVDRPRICDITADWLMGYTNGKLKFPISGSKKERNAAVASVKALLKNDPAAFEVLTRREPQFADAPF